MKIADYLHVTYFSTLENLVFLNRELSEIFVSCPVYIAQPEKYKQGLYLVTF